MWFVFDGAINTWVLKREWFYIGTTAQVDVAQRKLAAGIQWLLNLIDKHTVVDPRLVSATLKVSFLLASIVFIVLHE
jgi:hypothetical protein